MKRASSTICILLLFMITSVLQSCSKEYEVTNTAKAFFEDKIATQSRGHLKLLTFDKQNGIETEVFGRKLYKIEFRMVVEAQSEFWKMSQDGRPNWYWYTFTVQDHGSKGGWDDYGRTWLKFEKGQRVEIYGELDFEKTDNGWRPSKFYRITSAKDLNRSTSEVNLGQNASTPSRKSPAASNSAAQIATAQQAIRALEAALNLYRLDNSEYPTTEQGMNALVQRPTSPQPPHWKKGGYIDRLPLDPWQRPYQYLNPGRRGAIDIYTLGSDSLPGTDDDIGNWSLQ